MNTVIKNPFERFTQKGAAYVLWMCLLVAGCIASCLKSGDNTSQGTYYVVGFDGSSQVDEEKGTARSTGYLLISEEYKDLLLDNNLRDNLSSRSLDDIVLLTNLIADEFGNRIADPFDDIIDFPVESMHGGGCGYTLFPEKYRFVFKVQITYRPMTKEEERHASRLVFLNCYNPLSLKFNCVVIKSISK